MCVIPAMCSLLGFGAGGKATAAHKTKDSFDELMRIYLVIHADHEGALSFASCCLAACCAPFC